MRLKVVVEGIFPETGIELENFEQRLILQKSIYLIQRLGIDLGYRFSWYVHGPYAPDLTVAAFKYRDNAAYFDKCAEGYHLTEEGRSKVDILRKLIDARPRMPEMPIDQWLELLASIDYLKKVAYLPNIKVAKDNIAVSLNMYGKTKFDNSQIEASWDALIEHGFKG